MKTSLLLSLILHLSALGFVMSLIPEVQKSVVTMVELTSGEVLQIARLKKQKADRKSSQKLNKISSFKKRNISKDKLIGQDLETVKERKGLSPAASQSTFISYAQELQRYIEQNQYYPRQALVMNQAGKVVVHLKIKKDGTFSEVKLVEASQYNILNKAAQNLLLSLKKFKPFPKGYQGSQQFLVPIRYQVKR